MGNQEDLSVSQSYGYDAIGRLTSTGITEVSTPVSGTSTTKSRSYSYGYDKAGNRQYQSITEDGDTETDRYSYNNLYQLIKSEKGNRSNTGASVWQVEREYQYDAFGIGTLGAQYLVVFGGGGSVLLGGLGCGS